MMNYEIFKEVFKEKLLDYMPDEFKEHRVVEHKVFKVNCEKDAINLLPGDGKSKYKGSPTIYMGEFYEMYKNRENLDYVMNCAAELMLDGYKNLPEAIKNKDIAVETFKDRVVVTLVNTAQNEEYLKNIPHRDYLDLSIIYKAVISNDKSGMSSVVITNDVASQMGMNEEQLYEVAMKNTPELLPVSIQDMQDVISEMLFEEIAGDEYEVERKEIDDTISEVVEDNSQTKMYVMTNRRKINGAAEILFPENLDKLASILHSDIYIIPSSTHEVIAISSNGHSADELQEMVSDINMNQVDLEDRLSNEVYHYDRNKRELTIATNAPNKRLDGKSVAESISYDIQDKSL